MPIPFDFKTFKTRLDGGPKDFLLATSGFTNLPGNKGKTKGENKGEKQRGKPKGKPKGKTKGKTILLGGGCLVGV